MLSIEKCKEILNENEINYTNDEVKLIQKFLYEIVEIERRIKDDTERQERSALYSSINR